MYFDKVTQEQAKQTVKKDSLNMLEAQYNAAFALPDKTEANAIRKTYEGVMKRALNDNDTKDTNFIFLWFVKENLPVGLIGLIFAIIFLAAWGSIAAALNSLAACTVIDFHKKFFVKKETEVEDYKISQWYTLGWGIFSIIIVCLPIILATV